jgi:hypothetical protein
MKKYLSTVGIALIASIILVAMKSPPFKNLSKIAIATNTTSSNDKNAFVVLELFTSQGCSSCPSADELVGEYKNNPNVITLSFHVDYWNRLGWVDTFSNSAYSQRQRDYAEQLNIDGVYTPQLVVNGITEFVGSNKSRVEAAVNTITSKGNTSSISINEFAVNGDKLTVKFSSTSITKKLFYSVLLVQNEATTFIKHGENKGVQLTNYTIVRDLVKVNKADAAENVNVNLQLPKGFTKKDYAIVILEQESNGKVIGAIKKGL